MSNNLITGTWHLTSFEGGTLPPIHFNRGEFTFKFTNTSLIVRHTKVDDYYPYVPEDLVFSHNEVSRILLLIQQSLLLIMTIDPLTLIF